MYNALWWADYQFYILVFVVVVLWLSHIDRGTTDTGGLHPAPHIIPADGLWGLFR